MTPKTLEIERRFIMDRTAQLSGELYRPGSAYDEQFFRDRKPKDHAG